MIPPINVCMTAALIGGDKFFEEILKFSPRGSYSGGAVCYTHSGGWWKKNKKIFVLEGFLGGCRIIMIQQNVIGEAK